MAASSINPRAEAAPRVNVGHGTGALGPSDSSDSGSDVMGGPGLYAELHAHEGMPLDRIGSEDAGSADPSTAGPDLGDANLDSDSDRNGTGENASAGRDVPDAADIEPDRIDEIEDIEDIADSESRASPAM